MKLTNELLKTAIFGVVEFEEEAGALKMHRFTRKQRAYFSETENSINKPLKALANSNMVLDFYTDSTKFVFEAIGKPASRQNLCYFDLYINGTMVDNFGYESAEPGTVNYSRELAGGRKRITVYFPCLAAIEIQSVSLDDGASFEPAKRDRKLLFIGDSITQGYIGKYPSLTYSGIVMTGLNAESVNLGIGGNVFDELDLDADFPYTPDTIFVAYGTNDWSKKLDYKENARKFLDKLTGMYPEAKVYMVLPIWRANAKERKVEKNLPVDFEQVHIDLAKVAERYENVTPVNGLQLVPHIRETLCPDAVHPNELGFLFYGQELLKFVLAEEKVR